MHPPERQISPDHERLHGAAPAQTEYTFTAVQAAERLSGRSRSWAAERFCITTGDLDLARAPGGHEHGPTAWWPTHPLLSKRPGAGSGERKPGQPK
jgi:hypothetical protein